LRNRSVYIRFFIMPGRADLAQCNKCGLNFLNEEGLGKHTKRVHEEKEQVRPSKYKCDRCADEFLVKDDFKKHKLPEEFSCELCEKKGEVSILPTKCEYTFHIITHRIGKPKICDNCGSEFKNNKNLKNHKEQDKTVSCRRCNKIFTGSCPLQRHIKYEHDTKNEPIPPLQRQYSRQNTYNRSKPTIVVNQVNVKQEPTKVVTKQVVAPKIIEPAVKVKAEPTDSYQAQKPPAKKQKVAEKPKPLKVKMNFAKTVKNESTVQPLNDTIPQEFFIPPEFQPGLCANESILGI